MMRTFMRLAMPAFSALVLAGCGNLSRLAEIGRPPEMTPTTDPTRDPNWRPLSMPMPSRIAAPEEANSLWRPGSRAFFKDQRAAQVGDIVTILVNIADTAALSNVSIATRKGTEAMGIPNLFNLETALPTILGKNINPSTLVSGSSENTTNGNGTITQVLPNGNLVVSARQEVRVNSELRDLQVTGVIRSQDIASDNTVLHDRLAEARITYGGRGQLTDVQTPRYGQQLLDILLPF